MTNPTTARHYATGHHGLIDAETHETYDLCRAHRDAAGEAGDMDGVATCDRALDGDASAVETIREWERDAQAQEAS